MEKCNIYIWKKQDGQADECQTPVVVEGITWETFRKGEPSKLTFTCVKTDGLSFPEGAPVSFYYGETPVFRGRVFEKRRNKDQHIEVTCYDQLRYMSNQNTYVLKNVRADQVLTRIADDVGFKLKKDGIANTKFVIPKFDKSNMSLFDIILDALDDTVCATGDLYYMYDDFGEIVLKNIKDSILDNFILKDTTAEDFDYSSSIDSNTYNRIVVIQKSDKDQEKVTVFDDHAPKDSKQRAWGILQKTIEVQDGVNVNELGNTLLKLHSHVSRSIKFTGVMGNIHCRAGVGIFTQIELGDAGGSLRNLMLVDKAVHTFDNDHHYMELTLNGKREFYD